jgi:hypothetical protein
MDADNDCTSFGRRQSWEGLRHLQVIVACHASLEGAKQPRQRMRAAPPAVAS